jgi:hypothetical protein
MKKWWKWLKTQCEESHQYVKEWRKEMSRNNRVAIERKLSAMKAKLLRRKLEEKCFSWASCSWNNENGGVTGGGEKAWKLWNGFGVSSISSAKYHQSEESGWLEESNGHQLSAQRNNEISRRKKAYMKNKDQRNNGVSKIVISENSKRRNQPMAANRRNQSAAS